MKNSLQIFNSWGTSIFLKASNALQAVKQQLLVVVMGHIETMTKKKELSYMYYLKNRYCETCGKAFSKFNQ